MLQHCLIMNGYIWTANEPLSVKKSGLDVHNESLKGHDFYLRLTKVLITKWLCLEHLRFIDFQGWNICNNIFFFIFPSLSFLANLVCNKEDTVYLYYVYLLIYYNIQQEYDMCPFLPVPLHFLKHSYAPVYTLHIRNINFFLLVTIYFLLVTIYILLVTSYFLLVTS